MTPSLQDRFEPDLQNTDQLIKTVISEAFFSISEWNNINIPSQIFKSLLISSVEIVMLFTTVKIGVIIYCKV